MRRSPGWSWPSVIVDGVADAGFVTVGDIGIVRSDGGLSLRGWASNLVITGGKNVHPEEVEAALGADPSAAECVVVGLPHPYWGEQLAACVTPAPGMVFDQQRVRALLRSRIASYKIPKRWLVLDRLPKLPNGKTDRRQTRQLVEQAPLCSPPAARP